jgi:hypothetical protein
MRHLHPQPIDAATIPSVALAEYIRDSGRNSAIQKALDFVNVNNTKLETLFLCGKERLVSRSTLDGKLIHPPAVLRRTAKIIRDFYDLKVEDKFDLIEEYKSFINCTTGLAPYLESKLAPPSQLPTVTCQPRGGESVAAGSVRSTHSVTFADEFPVKLSSHPCVEALPWITLGV